MRRFSVYIFLILFCFISLDRAYSMKDPTRFDHTHSEFDKILKRNVSDGMVDYQGIISDNENFANYLESLGNITPEQYDSWTEQQQIAFWINAYNAFTLKAIIDNYPIKRSFTFVGIFYAPRNSILQIPGVWKKLNFRAVGEDVTLDHIEHGILRVKYDEPRIHAAINCASIGCPDLSISAYTADGLDAELDAASVRFVNNKDKGVLISPDGKSVKVSKIFKWFGEDFNNKYGSDNFSDRKKRDNGVLGYIAEYIEDESSKQVILSNDFKLSHLSYDWSLNEQLPGQN